MILETIPAIRSLTVDQKLRLVCELWEDVSNNPAISPGTASLLDERLEDYANDPGAVRTTEEVTAGIMKLKQRIAASRP